MAQRFDSSGNSCPDTPDEHTQAVAGAVAYCGGIRVRGSRFGWGLYWATIVAGLLYLFVPAILAGPTRVAIVASPSGPAGPAISSCQQAARAAADDADDPDIDPPQELTNRRSLISDCDTQADFSAAARQARLVPSGQDPLNVLAVACMHDLRAYAFSALCLSVKSVKPAS